MKQRPTELGIDLEALVKRSRIYAGIGSRSAPHPVLTLAGRIAVMLADFGLVLRSGAAPGADLAFEAGCDRMKGQKEIFLPWERFNGSQSEYFPPSEAAKALASLYHPNWTVCSEAARQLHARNCQQVFGWELDAPVDFVLFWAPEERGLVRGGTGMAVSLARGRGIPTFNLAHKPTCSAWEKSVNAYERRRFRLWKHISRLLEKRS